LTWSYQMGRARGFGLGSGMIMLSIVMAAVGMHWSARSHVYSYLPFLIVYYLLFMATSGRELSAAEGAVKAVCVGAAMCLWANLHGSFMIGVAMIAIKAVFEAIQFARNQNRALAASQLKWDAIALAVALGATCINPRGLSFYTHVANYLSNPLIVHRTDEWRAFDLFAGVGAWAFLLLIAITATLIWKTKKVPSAAELTLFIILLIAGFDSMRLIPYCALIAIPIAAPAWNVLKKKYAADLLSSADDTAANSDNEKDDSSTLPKEQSTNSPGRTRASGTRLERFVRFETRAEKQEPHGLRVAIGSIILALIMGAVMMAAPFSQIKDFDRERLPVDAVNLMNQKSISGLGFNYDNWGGYLYFKLHKPVFIDDWADFLPVKFVDDYVDVLTAKPGWQDKFDRYRFAWVLVPNESQLAQLLVHSADWKVMYKDKVAVLLVRNRGALVK
jgi:hypothetical protein